MKRQLGVQLRLTITDTRKVLAGDLEIPPVALNREKLSIFIPSVKKKSEETSPRHLQALMVKTVLSNLRLTF